MAKQIRKTLYTFQEMLDHQKSGKITAEAVEKARDWLREAVTDTPRVRALFEQFQANVEQLRLNLCEILYKALEKDHESQITDEALAEYSDIVEHTFDKCGHREG